MTNKDIGLTGSQQKELSELEHNLRTQQANLDFYSQEKFFTGIKPQSAKNLFGGRWKKIIAEAHGEDVLKKGAKYDNNKPIDFEISSFIVTDAKNFAKGDNVRVNVKTGRQEYNGIYKIIDKQGNFLITIAKYADNARGSMINESRREAFIKAIERTQKKIEGILSKNNEPAANNKQQNTSSPAKPAKKPKPVILLILLIIIIYLFYNQFKKQKS